MRRAKFLVKIFSAQISGTKIAAAEPDSEIEQGCRSLLGASTLDFVRLAMFADERFVENSIRTVACKPAEMLDKLTAS